MKKKFLLIGGAGFIGTQLTKTLLARPQHSVHVIDNFSRSSREKHTLIQMAEESTALTVTSADLTKKESLELLDKTYDYLVMLAAVVGVDKANGQPHEVIRINTLLTINVLEWLETASSKLIDNCDNSFSK